MWVRRREELIPSILWGTGAASSSCKRRWEEEEEREEKDSKEEEEEEGECRRPEEDSASKASTSSNDSRWVDRPAEAAEAAEEVEKEEDAEEEEEAEDDDGRRRAWGCALLMKDREGAGDGDALFPFTAFDGCRPWRPWSASPPRLEGEWKALKATMGGDRAGVEEVAGEGSVDAGRANWMRGGEPPPWAESEEEETAPPNPLAEWLRKGEGAWGPLIWINWPSPAGWSTCRGTPPIDTTSPEPVTHTCWGWWLPGWEVDDCTCWEACREEGRSGAEEGVKEVTGERRKVCPMWETNSVWGAALEGGGGGAAEAVVRSLPWGGAWTRE
jgi:hypothetical protein